MRVNPDNEASAAIRGTGRRTMSLFERVAMSSALAITMMLVSSLGATPAEAGNQERSDKHYLIDKKHLHDLKVKVDEMKDRMKRQRYGSGDGSSQSLSAQVMELQNQIAALSTVNTSLMTQLQTAVSEIALLRNRVNTLELNSGGSSSELASLAKYVTVDTNPINGVKGPHIIFHDANVHIRSGSNMTDDGGLLRGLGNLFIGYNESPDPSVVYDVVGCDRAATGSHNLVVGKGNLVTSYGSAVLGSQNCVTAKQASILGGEVNEAHLSMSAILGGNRSVIYDYNRPYATLPQVPQ